MSCESHVIYFDRLLKQHVPKITARIFITPPMHILAGDETADGSEQKYCPSAIVSFDLTL